LTWQVLACERLKGAWRARRTSDSAEGSEAQMTVGEIHRIRFLYAYNRWANARALEAAAALSPEQLQRDLGTSHRSVFGTLSHILWGEWRWLGRWLAPAPAPGLDPQCCPDLDALRARWTEVESAQRAFLNRVSEEALEMLMTYENPRGTPWTYPLGQMLVHLVNHSTYHRGQVTALLRQLGADAVATDFLVFVDEQGQTGTDLE
jgi:uncharacterized damage-inducible protein DinB